jgi:hypothetical protein
MINIQKGITPSQKIMTNINVGKTITFKVFLKKFKDYY